MLSEDAITLAQEGDAAAVSYIMRHVVISADGGRATAEGGTAPTAVMVPSAEADAVVVEAGESAKKPTAAARALVEAPTREETMASTQAPPRESTTTAAVELSAVAAAALETAAAVALQAAEGAGGGEANHQAVGGADDSRGASARMSDVAAGEPPIPSSDGPVADNSLPGSLQWCTQTGGGAAVPAPVVSAAGAGTPGTTTASKETVSGLLGRQEPVAGVAPSAAGVAAPVGKAQQQKLALKGASRPLLQAGARSATEASKASDDGDGGAAVQRSKLGEKGKQNGKDRAEGAGSSASTAADAGVATPNEAGDAPMGSSKSTTVADAAVGVGAMTARLRSPTETVPAAVPESTTCMGEGARSSSTPAPPVVAETPVRTLAPEAGNRVEVEAGVDDPCPGLVVWARRGDGEWTFPPDFRFFRLRACARRALLILGAKSVF